MKQAEITIINAELNNIKNDKTGEISQLTKINYAIKMADTKVMVGYSILECWKQGNLLDSIKPYCMQKIKADIEERATKNGSKYVLLSINGKELK